MNELIFELVLLVFMLRRRLVLLDSANGDGDGDTSSSASALFAIKAKYKLFSFDHRSRSFFSQQQSLNLQRTKLSSSLSASPEGPVGARYRGFAFLIKVNNIISDIIWINQYKKSMNAYRAS